MLFLVEAFAPLAAWLIQRGTLKVINTLTALLGFSLTFIPALLRRVAGHRIRLSQAMSCGIVLFIFCAQFLGEIKNFYYLYPWWDIFLHIVSGVILGIIGLMLAYSLNTHIHTGAVLTPFFVCLFGFCFALAAGAVWEIFEFLGDRLFGMNMQKYLPPSGTTQLYTDTWRFDAGLIDTMTDIIFSMLSTLATSVAGYFFLKRKMPLQPSKTEE